MKIGNVAAAILALAFVGGIAAALLHRRHPAAGQHVAVIIDVSGAGQVPVRCEAAQLSLRDLLTARSGNTTVDAWVTGTRRRSDREPIHLGTWSREAHARPVELPPDDVDGAAPAVAEMGSLCADEPPADQSPLFAAMAAALDGLRPVGCDGAAVECLVLFATDGIETEDPTLMAAQAGAESGAARLDNRGIDVILCGGSARVPIKHGALPPRSAVESAWRSEFLEPSRVVFYPVCVPSMWINPT